MLRGATARDPWGPHGGPIIGDMGITGEATGAVAEFQHVSTLSMQSLSLATCFNRFQPHLFWPCISCGFQHYHGGFDDCHPRNTPESWMLYMAPFLCLIRDRVVVRLLDLAAGSDAKLLAKNEVTDSGLLKLFDELPVKLVEPVGISRGCAVQKSPQESARLHDAS